MDKTDGRADGKAFRNHMMEVCAGFALACILTLAFMGPLRWAGKVSLSAFVVALPLLVTARIAIHDEDIECWPTVFFFCGLGIAIVAFALLLWEVFPIAAGLFVLATLGMYVYFVSQIKDKQVEHDPANGTPVSPTESSSPLAESSR